MKKTYAILTLLFTFISFVNAQDTIVQVGSLGPDKGFCKMVSPSVGYGIKGNYNIVKTLDSGKTWTSVHSLQSGGAYNYNCLDAYGKRIITGLNSGGRTYLSEDEGATWTQILIGKNQRVSHINFRDSVNVYAVLNGNTGSVDTPYVYRSYNGGNNWKYFSKSTYKSANAKLFFGSEKDVFLPIWGEDSVLLKSSDSAKTWQVQKVPFEIRSEQLLAAFNSNKIYVYGYNRRLYLSTDGGITWTDKYTVPNSYNMTDMYFVNDSTGYFISYYSTSYESRLHKVQSSGNSIQVEAIEPDAFARYFAFVNSNVMMFHSINGRFYHLKGKSSGLGNKEFSSANFSIYPNPTSQNLYLNELENGSDVSIKNLAGQTLRTYYLEPGLSNKLNVSDLSNGTYLIEIRTKNSVGTRMFVKE